MHPILAATLALLILAAPCASTVGAGPPQERGDDSSEATLADFEKEATRKERDRGPKTREREDHEDCGGCDACEVEQEDLFLTFCVEAGARLVLAGAYGGIGSWTRMEGASEAEWAESFPRRRAGEALIPIFALDVSRQSVLSDVAATETRGELGYGPFGFLVRATDYREASPGDDLKILQTHLLYRMSFSEHVELDVGAGTLALLGHRRHEGFSLTLPLRVQPWSAVGLEYRPVWGWIRGNTISDHTVTLSARLPFLSLNAGYRWVSTGSASLDGPLVGVGIHF